MGNGLLRKLVGWFDELQVRENLQDSVLEM